VAPHSGDLGRTQDAGCLSLGTRSNQIDAAIHAPNMTEQMTSNHMAEGHVVALVAQDGYGVKTQPAEFGPGQGMERGLELAR
jgi:hypothetical protein